MAITQPDGKTWRGWLLPSDPQSAEGLVRLKLPSGYNIGVLIEGGSTIEVIPGLPWGEEAHVPSPQPTPAGEENPKPGVVLLATGGTIASRVDYVTGGVKPVKGKAALDGLFPDGIGASDIAVKDVFDILSEDMGPSEWTRLAEEVHSAFKEGAAGVVVSHGTDTMAYTASALAFQLRDLPGPVALVGAQRSIDRPSSDGVSNLRNALRVARVADLGEVVVVMHSGLDDTTVGIHRGTRVRKMHSTRRDAFRSIGVPPIGLVGGSIILDGPHIPRSRKEVRIEPGFDARAELLWIHPGLTEETAQRHTKGVRGVVLAGTGMGHVSKQLVRWVHTAVANDTLVTMTTQCLDGTVDPYVYSRGRELLSAGVVFLGDMLPETALVKLMWVLKRSPDTASAKELMQANIAGETTARRTVVTEVQH